MVYLRGICGSRFQLSIHWLKTTTYSHCTPRSLSPLVSFLSTDVSLSTPYYKCEKPHSSSSCKQKTQNPFSDSHFSLNCNVKEGSFFTTMATRLGALRAKLVSVNGYSELGSSVAEFSEADQQRCCCSCRVICDKITSTTRRLVYVFDEAVRMGKSDPRKIVFAAKMGLALIVISLLIFLKEPVIELNRYYVWAILTVVVVFEFSIGTSFLFLFWDRFYFVILFYGLFLSCI